jgi:hypothetical protein
MQQHVQLQMNVILFQSAYDDEGRKAVPPTVRTNSLIKSRLNKLFGIIIYLLLMFISDDIFFNLLFF